MGNWRIHGLRVSEMGDGYRELLSMETLVLFDCPFCKKAELGP